MKKFTLNEVVEAMIIAEQHPEYKAHADRRLKSYVTRRCFEIDARPSQVVAGVKAAVTKRKLRK